MLQIRKVFVLLLFFIVLIPSKVIFAANLLRGDPSFETGLNGWVAISAPRKFEYMSNRFFEFRRNGIFEASIVEIDNAPDGDKVLELESRVAFENHVTGSPVKLRAGKEMEFSAFVRCKTPATLIQGIVRESNRKKKKAFKRFYASSRKKVGIDWKQFKLRFRTDTTENFIPDLKLEGKSVCQFDALMLSELPASPKYTAPRPVSLAISSQFHSEYRMPNLITANLEKPLIVTISLYNNDSSTISGRLSLVASDPYGNPIAADHVNLTLSAKKRRVSKLSLDLPEVGVWKLNSEFSPLSHAGLSSHADASFVKIRVDKSATPDPFFGAHEKWDPLTQALGFGSIRDLNMMRWIDVNPTPDVWKGPNPEELLLIDSYIKRGGNYLVTLVAEAPYQNPWSKKNWGSKNYGPVPLWAGASTDTNGGMFGKFSRKLKKEAIRKYIIAVASNYPNFELEFMNEPNHYMKADEYLIHFGTAWEALRESNSKQSLVAFSSPPTYPYLSGGSKKLVDPEPYKWFKEYIYQSEPGRLSIAGLHTYGRYRREEVPETSYGGIGEAKWAKGISEIKGAEDTIIWITEKGISTIPWKESTRVDSKLTDNRVDSPLTQARWLVRAQIDAKAKGIKRFYIFNRVWSSMVHDRYLPRGDQSYTFFEVDGQPLPILAAQRVLIEQLSHTHPIAEGSPGSGTRYALFKHKVHKHLVAAIWAYGSDQYSEIRMANLQLSCPSIISETQAIGMFGQQIRQVCRDGALTITPSPIYIIFPKDMSVDRATAALNDMSII